MIESIQVWSHLVALQKLYLAQASFSHVFPHLRILSRLSVLSARMVVRWFKGEKQIREQRWIVQIVQLVIAVLAQDKYLLQNLTYAF